MNCELFMMDVLIAGGGIAGSSLAIMLGRLGISVSLFEKATFPREKPCGEGLMPAGVQVLSRLGLEQAVGGAHFKGVRYHFRGKLIEGEFPHYSGHPTVGYGQRRKYLDDLLFTTAANTPGVRAHFGTRVDRPIRENGRVVGLVVEGDPVRASLVVVADGLHSRLRGSLGLDGPRARRRRFGMRAHFRLAGGQTQPPWVEIFVGDKYELYVAPLPHSEILIAGLAEMEVAHERPDRLFKSWLKRHPALLTRLDGAEQITELKGVSPLCSGALRGVTPGAVLLGDAAGFLDPITGGGMAQALVSAELLARYFMNGLETRDDWIWKFERERQKLLRDYQWLTRLVLWLVRHPTVAEQVFRVLSFSPALFSHLIGVSGGTCPLIKFHRNTRDRLQTSS